MKKPTTPARDLEQAFSKAKVHGAVHVTDDPNVEVDVEARAYLLLRDIADLYCAKPGYRPLCPKTHLEADGLWGPYYIDLMPYDRNEKGFNPGDDDLVDFDPDIYDGLRAMVADLSLYGTINSEITEAYGVHRLFCRNIDDLTSTTRNLIINQECPGSLYTRQNLYRKLQDIIQAVRLRQERGEEPAMKLN